MFQNLNICLWNNSRIKYKNNCLFFKNWSNANVNFIHNILNNGEIISYDRLLEIIGDTPTLLFQYNVIRSALLANAAVGLLRTAVAEVELSQRPLVSSPLTARVVRHRLSAA